MQVTGDTNGTILIIDDDRMIVDLVKLAFAGDNFQVVAAQSGKEFQELVDKLNPAEDPPYDLVLLDLLLPDTSGEELYRLLRANDHLAKIPIIILSAAAALQRRIQLLKMGADDYIIKPFNVDDLIMRANVHVKLGKLTKAKTYLDNRYGLLEEIAGSVALPLRDDYNLDDYLNRLRVVIQAAEVDIFLPLEVAETAATKGIRTRTRNSIVQETTNQDSITGQVLAAGKPIRLNETEKDGRFNPLLDQPQGQTTTSLLAIPISIGGSPVGVLRLFNKTNGNFSAEDKSLAVSAVNILSIALENIYLNQLLESTN